MRWQGRERSQNVEDRRGMRPTTLVAGGGGILTLLIALVAMYLGADPKAAMQMVGGQQAAQQQIQQQAPAPDDKSREFIEVVLKDTENVWNELFREQVQGADYVPPQLIIFSETDRSGCGIADARMGPFYCPADQKVYIDPSFFDEMKRRLGVAGRLCPGLRHRARGRSPCAEAHGLQRNRGPRAQQRRQVGSESRIGAFGIAGGLSGRRLGAPRAA